MNHKQKVKLARTMGGFNSKRLQERKETIALRVENKIKKIKLAIKIKKEK
jgi:hypothetical protein